MVEAGILSSIVENRISRIGLPPAGARVRQEPHHARVRGPTCLEGHGRFTEFNGEVTVGDAIEGFFGDGRDQTQSVNTDSERATSTCEADDFRCRELSNLTFTSPHSASAGSSLRPGRPAHDLDVTAVTLRGSSSAQARHAGRHLAAFSAHTTIEREDWDLTWNVRGPAVSSSAEGRHRVGRRLQLREAGSAVVPRGRRADRARPARCGPRSSAERRGRDVAATSASHCPGEAAEGGRSGNVPVVRLRLAATGCASWRGRSAVRLTQLAGWHGRSMGARGLGVRSWRDVFNASFLFIAPGGGQRLRRSRYDVDLPGKPPIAVALFASGEGSSPAGRGLRLRLSSATTSGSRAVSGLMTSGANVLARPVGVPAGDGRAHWEVLLRARAVEQAYVLRRRSGVWSSTT